MAKTRITYIPGANKRYPQWNEINEERMAIFREFHKQLRNLGYNIRCANVAEKDGSVYWILLSNDGTYKLEHYGYLNQNRKKGESYDA